MKKVLLALVIVVLSVLTVNSVYAQDPADIAKGAALWANNCTRCHNARSPMERNDRGWVTVVNHMRARANLTKSEARAIAAYLQAVNLPETSAALSAREIQNRTGETQASRVFRNGTIPGHKGNFAPPEGQRLASVRPGSTGSFLMSHTRAGDLRE